MRRTSPPGTCSISGTRTRLRRTSGTTSASFPVRSSSTRRSCFSGTAPTRTCSGSPALFLGLRYYFSDGRLALFVVWFTLLATPAVMREFVTGGDLIANSVYVLLFVLGVIRFDASARGGRVWKVAAALALGVALSSRPNFLFIVPLVFACLVRRESWRSAVDLRRSRARGLRACVTLPFYLHDTSGFSPLLTEGKFARLNGVLPHSSTVVLVAAGSPDALSGLAADRRGTTLSVFRNDVLVQGFLMVAVVVLSTIQAGRLDFSFLVTRVRVVHRLRRGVRDLGRSVPEGSVSILAVVLRPASGRFPFGVVVPVAVGGTVFAFACGSSSVHVVRQVGHPLRWGALLVLLVLAAGWACERREGLLLPRSVVVATGALLSVALVSALWSVDSAPVGRAGGLARDPVRDRRLLLAQACAGRPREIAARAARSARRRRRPWPSAGLIVLVAAHGSAVEPATIGSPTRYQGLGENPDTAALLFAVTLPIARLVPPRAAGAGAVARSVPRSSLLLFGSIVASGSRGALFAARDRRARARRWSGEAARVAPASRVAAVAAVVVVGALLETRARRSPDADRAARRRAVAEARVQAVALRRRRGCLPAGRRRRPAAAGRRGAVEAALVLRRERAQRGLDGRDRAGRGPAAARLRLRHRGRVFVDRYFTFVGGLDRELLHRPRAAARDRRPRAPARARRRARRHRLARARRPAAGPRRRLPRRPRRRPRDRRRSSRTSTPSATSRRPRSGSPRSCSRRSRWEARA